MSDRLPPATRPRAEVHLRVLVPDDAAWVVDVDRDAATTLATGFDWEPDTLTAELDEGRWACDERWAWAIAVDGRPGGFALVVNLDSGAADMAIRISHAFRGRGVGREVLRQLADHHFQAQPDLQRLAGRAHEHNVPMQRAFNAAGFRMEARYRDSFRQPDGRYASEWGYALTRADWESGRHRRDAQGYDLHGLTFVLDETVDGPETRGMLIKFLQEGRRAIARYDGWDLAEGELAGLLVGDVLRYRFVHVIDARDGSSEQTGRGRARVQRRGDGRLEIVDDWSDDRGGHGRRVLLERREG